MRLDENKAVAKTGRRGVTKYSENPFWEPTEVKIGKKRVSVAGGMHVSDDGESVKHGGIHVIEEVDREQFVKLYTKNIRVFFDLKPTTQKVLAYLITQLQESPGADSIYLAFVAAQKHFSETDVKISRASFHRALKELLEKKFIAESDMPNMFWFNPHLFFNGDRMTFIREFRVKTKEAIATASKEIADKSETDRDPDTVDFINGKADSEAK